MFLLGAVLGGQGRGHGGFSGGLSPRPAGGSQVNRSSRLECERNPFLTESRARWGLAVGRESGTKLATVHGNEPSWSAFRRFSF